jgi:hypothetical protein
MAKSAQQTSERAELLAAHEQRTAAQAVLAEAESAHNMAIRDLHGAQIDVDDIVAEIRQLKATRTYGLPHLLAEVNEKLAIAYTRNDNATRAVPPFAAAAAEAKARVDALRYPAVTADHRVSQAAAAVVRAEAEPIARQHLARVLAAFDVIAAHGPDLLVLVDKGLAPPDIVRQVKTAADGLLGKANSDWPEFVAACRASHWRAVQQMLEQDPQATLPAAAS